jgi:hypothetical protein
MLPLAALALPMFPVSAAAIEAPETARSAHSAIQNQKYTLESYWLGRCVVSHGWISDATAPCNQRGDSRFQFNHQAGIVYKILDRDGKCISDHPAGGLGPMTCTARNEPLQRWWLWYDSHYKTHALVNGATGRCISQTHRHGVHMAKCDGSVFQEWILGPA